MDQHLDKYLEFSDLISCSHCRICYGTAYNMDFEEPIPNNTYNTSKINDTF